MKCIVYFTEAGRKKLAKYLGIAHCICVAPSLICLLAALYIQILIEDKISFIEDYNGVVLPAVLVFTGFFGLIAHVVCGKIFWINNRPDKREKWSKHLLPAVIVTLVIFLLEVCSSVVCFAHISSLEESFHKGITGAMNAYKNDAERKAEMDTLQMTYECCGSRAYTDWFYIGWIHPDYMSRGSKYAMAHRGKGGKGFISDDVPFSCCNPSAMRFCISHHLQDNSLHYNYKHEKDLTVYRNGCTNVLMDFYQDGVLVAIGVTILCLSFIQAVTSVAGRLLQTAILEAMASGDGKGPSVGYICKCGQKTPTSEEQQSLLDSTQDSGTTDATASIKMPNDGEHIYSTLDESMNETFESVDEHPYANLPLAPPPPPPAPPPPMASGKKTQEVSYADDGDYENAGVGLKEVKSRRGSYMSMMDSSTPIRKGSVDPNRSRLGSGVSFNIAKNAVDGNEQLNSSAHNNSLDEMDACEGVYWVDQFGNPVPYPQTRRHYLPVRSQSKSNHQGDFSTQLLQQRNRILDDDSYNQSRRPSIKPSTGHNRSRSRERLLSQSEMHTRRSSVSPLKKSPSKMKTAPLSPYRTSTPRKAMTPEARQSVSAERSYERRKSSSANCLSNSYCTPRRSRGNDSSRALDMRTPSPQKYKCDSNQDRHRRRSESALSRRTSSPTPRRKSDVSIASRRSSAVRGDRMPLISNRSGVSQKDQEKQHTRRSSSEHARRRSDYSHYELAMPERRDQNVRRTVESPPRRRSSSVPRTTSSQTARKVSSRRDDRQRSKSVQAIRASSPSKPLAKRRHSSDYRVGRSRR